MQIELNKKIIALFEGNEFSLDDYASKFAFKNKELLVAQSINNGGLDCSNPEEARMWLQNPQYLLFLLYKNQIDKFIKNPNVQSILLRDLAGLEQVQVNLYNQNEFLRQAGTERQQMVDLDKEMQEKLQPLLQSQFFDAVKPTTQKPDYLMIFGASEAGCRIRLRQAAQDIKDGVINPEKIALLAGERPGWALQEPILYEILARIMQIPVEKVRRQIFEIADKYFPQRSPDIRNNYDDPKFFSGLNTNLLEAFRNEVRKYYEQAGLTKWPTETDIIIAVFNEFPELQKYSETGNLIVVNAHMKGNSRPTTEDTIKAFKAMVDSNNITIVAYSNQPHIPYQDATLAPHFKKREVVGSGIENPHYSEALDAVARLFYTMMQQMLQQRLQQLKIVHEAKSSHSFCEKVKNERLMTITSTPSL